MIAIYGVLNRDGVHIDVSLSLLGAKQYATRNGYSEVSKRIGYNAMIVARKINNNWENFPLPF